MSGFADSNTFELIRTELVRSVPPVLTAVITLALTWVIGHRLAVRWAIWQKRRELDITSTNQFYSLYGEFLAVWRLWKVLREDEGNTQEKPFGAPTTGRFDLLTRAAIAEGNVEALILKLVAERLLSDDQLGILGLFRQAYQQMREHIRDDRAMNWIRSDPEYQLSKELAAKMAHLLSAEHSRDIPSSDRTVDALAKVTACRNDDWKRAVEQVESGRRSKYWGFEKDV